LVNMVSSRSLLTVFATFIAVATSQKCYAVDGTALDSTYTPCNPSAKHSSCCASTDICMSNGLCMGTMNESIGMIFSRGCTDSKGNDASCQQMCPGGTFTETQFIFLVLQLTHYSFRRLQRSQAGKSLATSNMRLGRILLPRRQ
jgi:hypothetical protein